MTMSRLMTRCRLKIAEIALIIVAYSDLIVLTLSVALLRSVLPLCLSVCLCLTLSVTLPLYS